MCTCNKFLTCKKSGPASWAPQSQSDTQRAGLKAMLAGFVPKNGATRDDHIRHNAKWVRFVSDANGILIFAPLHSRSHLLSL